MKKAWVLSYPLSAQRRLPSPSEDSDQPGHPPSLIRVFAVRMKKTWVLSYPLSAQQRLWSDWADAQADLSLRWTHSHRSWFSHVAAQLLTMWLYHRVMSPKDADGMANNVDPDQTVPLSAVGSGPTLFVQTFLSENLGSLRLKENILWLEWHCQKCFYVRMI